MDWSWNKEYLDVILVPLGLLIMVGYHSLLLVRHFRNKKKREEEEKKKSDQKNKKGDNPPIVPKEGDGTTAIDHEHFYRGLWVERMMQVDYDKRGQAVTVINNNISAAFTLSTISMTISALIGTWFSNTSIMIPSTLVYGNTSQSIVAYKHIGLLICFLVAFAAFLQCARCLVHSSFLLSMPSKVDPKHVTKAVVSGSVCWSVGMRALYFAITLLLWVFGPIPMFVSSVVMVLVLIQLDWNDEPLVTYEPLESLKPLEPLLKPLLKRGLHKIEEEVAPMVSAIRDALTVDTVISLGEQ